MDIEMPGIILLESDSVGRKIQHDDYHSPSEIVKYHKVFQAVKSESRRKPEMKNGIHIFIFVTELNTYIAPAKAEGNEICPLKSTGIHGEVL
ncbi:MAG: hypothetical protein OIN88_14570 [Candidatus Methanoperedens sp.]|nr:hypothetical protein [Candidatus Methanoperedens sp.]